LFGGLWRQPGVYESQPTERHSRAIVYCVTTAVAPWKWERPFVARAFDGCTPAVSYEAVDADAGALEYAYRDSLHSLTTGTAFASLTTCYLRPCNQHARDHNLYFVGDERRRPQFHDVRKPQE
jgi:hypothetical protein